MTGDRSAVVVGGAALVVSGVQYVVAEAVTATAWMRPPYSYTHDYISELGQPSCGTEPQGPVLCSPLYPVMNTGFLLHGVLSILAAVLLIRLLSGRVRWAALIFAVVHGVGIVLVGLVHVSPEGTADGSVVWHNLGAAMAIFGGNITWIVVGSHLVHRRRARLLGLAQIALGSLGVLAAVLFLGGVSVLDVGTVERAAVYPIIAAELVTGVTLMGSWLLLKTPRPGQRQLSRGT